jgi:hypothetical protein
LRRLWGLRHHQVKHVTTTPHKEVGATDYWRISNVVRDNLTAQKLLVEARIRSGPHSAVQPRWLKYAITSALLRASDGELVEPNIHERFDHSSNTEQRLDAFSHPRSVRENHPCVS